MATQGIGEAGIEDRHSTAEDVAGGSQWHPLTAAALVGGAIAAGGAAYLGTRALARRNGASEGKPVNSVMANAITACDVKP
jgi:hypothetical protein